MKTGTPTNGSMVKNHISLKTGFGYHAIRKTSFLLWFQVCQVRSTTVDERSGRPDIGQANKKPKPNSTLRTPFKQESHSSSSSSSSSPTVSEIQIREREDEINSDISPVQVSASVDDRSGQPDETTIEREATRCVLTSRSGCKNSGKCWWMMKLLNAETHTPVLLMKYL